MVITIWAVFMVGSSRQLCDKRMELTILLPCLNEEKTVAVCVRQAAAFLLANGLQGEVLVSDNGSTDQSARLAKEAGARVVSCPKKGYGNALRFGLNEAQGKYVIMGDCDCSYHFDELLPLIRQLREGAELVVGDRFIYPCEQGAMRFSHRYIGVPLLSLLGRIFFHTQVRDFHCGLRGVNRESYQKLDCRYTGMEFATEMIGRAALQGQKISQVPVRLYRDNRGRPSHLRSIRDGWRHLRVILSRCNCEVF